VQKLASVVLLVAVAMLGGCASRLTTGPGAASLTPFAKRVSVDSASLPRHVVILVQENRSVDNLFQRLPGADTQSWGLDVRNQRIPLRAIHLSSVWDPSHGHSAFVTEFANGKLNGFGREKCTRCGRYAAYSYVFPDEVKQYYAMAEQYAFADHNLQPNEGPSWPAHLYLIAAQSGSPGSTWYVSENAGGPPGYQDPNLDCLAPPGSSVEEINMSTVYPGTEGHPTFPCVSPPTILTELESARLTWKYYTPNPGNIWTAPCDISGVCPSPHVVSPETTVLTDIANGKLANVSWVIPSEFDSDHPGSGAGNRGGPQWVSAVVDAIGESPYWMNTAIFVVWDDWGGWYDHYLAGNGHPAARPTDPYEYGFRVPLIAIGAYVRPGYLSHTPRDSTSLLHFIEDDFGLPSLNELDAQTDDLFELFNLGQNPNQFQPFDMGSMTLQQRRMQPPDLRPVDDD
jgi:phospholipase C